MYEKLAKEIATALDSVAPRPPQGEDPVPMHRDTVTRLKAVTDFPALLDALAALDGLVAAYATLELSRYSPSTPLGAQADRSDTLLGYGRFLFDVYRNVSRNATAHVENPTGDLATFVSRITVENVTGPGRAFLAEVRGFVLLSLWVGSRSAPGATLITELARSNAAVRVKREFMSFPSSLRAVHGGPGALAATAHPVPKGGDIRVRADSITRGTGAPSELPVPIWLDEPDEELVAHAFTSQTVEYMLLKILSGSVSFTRDGVPFYSPVRIELLHELIHVLHNARGENRVEVKTLEHDEAEIFSNAEEYWTIEGGDLTENMFNETIGAPDRHGHIGARLAALRRSPDNAEQTLRQLAV